MKDVLWVFRSFGFKLGVRYCWDALCLGVRRKLGLSPKPIDFSGLSFEDIEDMKETLNGTDNRTLH